jgi:RNA polymerase sigma-70 factor (ECF subfamily)
VSLTAQYVESNGEPDDASLIARARAGDDAAINSLVRRYLGDVYAVASRVLSDPELAQDAAQDALVNAVRALHRFRGEASFRTWLLRITVNAARSIARKQFRRREVSLEEIQETPNDETDVASVVAINDEASRAARALTQLPEKQRMAVTLRTTQGLSYHEIGTVLDCTEGAARVNYHLGVKRLRELMK